MRYISVSVLANTNRVQSGSGSADHICTAYLKTVVSKEEAKGLIEPTTRIPSTDKYVFELEVFHQLHCLHYIRKAMFNPNVTEVEFMTDPDITPEHIGNLEMLLC